MKTRITRALAIALSVLMLVSVLPLSGMAAEYAFGDIITLGSYPQAEVTDSATLSALNAQALHWVSYGYYSAPSDYDAAQQGDFMQYADVSYAGSKYRAVRFTAYRPSVTSYASTADFSYQDDNGYALNTTYWFQYEPLQWRVLDPTTGLVVSEYGIDAQAYANKLHAFGDQIYNTANEYANDYATSDIREWLNDDFYNTAFSSSEKEGIYAKNLETGTADKVFLLSLADLINAGYGFHADENNFDPARRAHSTDYAKCQGANTTTEYSTSGGLDCSGWWLRTPNSGYSRSAGSVWASGNVSGEYADTSSCSVRPAVILYPDSVSPVEPPEEDVGFLDRIKAFFRRIIDWFKSLFGG